jgi:hypothetical protein
VTANDGALGHFPGAQHLMRISATRIFVNCGRYIHNMETLKLSAHVPDAAGHQPFPAWKRIDVIADSLAEPDQARVREVGGTIPVEAYRGENDPT